MIISYKPGLEILSQHLDKIQSGEILQIVFFLGTNSDDTFLESLVNNFIDLNYLSGDNCLLVSFMPPKKGMLYRSAINQHGFYFPEANDINFINAMTQ